MKKITYTEPKNSGTPAAGKTLTNGMPEEISGIEVVRFAEKVNGKPLCLRIDTRPELAKLVAEYKAGVEAENVEFRKKWAAERAAEAAETAPLLAAMEAEAAELRKLIPSGNLAVEVKQTGSLDGDPIYSYTVDDQDVSWSDVIVHGWASAQWPTAMAPFASICVASISAEKLAEIKTKKAEIAKEKADKKAAEEKRIAEAYKQAKETGVKVAIRSWSEDCNDPREECSLDNVTEWAMPDGTTKTTRQHSW